MGSFNASTISFNTTGTMQIGMAVTSQNATEYAIGEFDQFKITLPQSATSLAGNKRALRGVEYNSEWMPNFENNIALVYNSSHAINATLV